MPRPHRIEFPGAFYHVYARGNNKQKIFMDSQDYTTYLSRIARYYNRYPFILYAYTLMSNHFHFAIETCEIPLSKIMHGIQQSYSQYIQKKYSYVGHLFQGPYGAILYDKDEYALNLVRYIHRNPIEARLVEDPIDYPWSSHRIYMNLESCSFLDKKFVLDMFPCSETRAIQMFSKFVLKGTQILEELNFDDVRDRQIIGNKQFVESVKNRIKTSSRDKKYVLNNDFNASGKKTLSEILKIVSKQTKVSADSILTKSQFREITSARRIFAFISAKYGGYGTVEIARFLKKDASSVSLMIHKLENELKYDSVLPENLWKIIHIFKARPQS